MNRERLGQILNAVSGLRAGVIGDFCVDAYWTLAQQTEVSLETGRSVHVVTRQHYSPGGAGNVAANLAALGVGGLAAFALVGNDPFAEALRRMLADLGADTSGLIEQAADWETPCYCKPMRGGQEQDRLDLGGGNVPSVEAAGRLADALAGAWDQLDLLIVNQQLTRSLWTGSLLEALNSLAGQGSGPLCVLNCRDSSLAFPPMARVLNSREAAGALGWDGADEDDPPLPATVLHGRRLADAAGAPVLITRGADGAVVFHADGYDVVEAVRVDGPIDPVGAGDASVAAFAAALAAGGLAVEAAELAGLASAVTVKKLLTTGTASPGEIAALLGRSKR